MTINITKKHLFIGLGIIVAIGIIVLFGSLFRHKANYEKTAQNMKINTMAVSYMAASILSDYQKNWQSAINDHHVQDENGKRIYCSDFSDAIRMRYRYYEKNGYFLMLDSLCGVVKTDMKTMNEAASPKYEKTQEAFMEMYNNMNSLVSLTKEPKGSLITFGSTVNDYIMSLESKKGETDLFIAVSDDEIQSKISDLMLSILIQKEAKDMEEKKILEQKAKATHEENVAMMKKDGFMPLKDGEGILYKELEVGNGILPSRTAHILVDYEVRLIDGKVLDSSHERRTPFTVDLANPCVIRGWEIVLKHMSKGAKWEVLIPYTLAYNDQKTGLIEPYSDLVVTIEIRKIQ